MKWIGQHIWDFISRFRSDVYMEAVESGTIASGGNLGLDSNNKVVKAAEVGSSVDLTSEVTGILPVANGGSGASSLADNSVLTGTGASPITAESTLTYDGSVFNADCANFTIENSTTGTLTVQNTAANATGGTLNLKNTHNGSDADVSDYCGYIKFWGQDDGTPSLTEYGNIDTQITDVANGDEAGTMRLRVLNNTGTGALLDGIAIYGNTDTDGEVDVDIASGVASVTTIAGDLDIDGDNMTTAGAMTLTTGGAYEIATGSGNITLDSAGNITLETTDNHFYTTIDRRKFTVTSDIHNEHNGDVIYTGSGTTVLGDIVYLRTTGAWAPADAANEDMVKALLGIALGVDPATDGVLIRGMYTLNHDVGNDQGVPVYLSLVSGEATATAPSASGKFVRVLGYNLGNDDQIWFDPDKTYIEIA